MRTNKIDTIITLIERTVRAKEVQLVHDKDHNNFGICMELQNQIKAHREDLVVLTALNKPKE